MRRSAPARRSSRVVVTPYYRLVPRGALPPDYDDHIATYRDGLSENHPDTPVVHAVTRDGGALTVIRGHPPSP